MLGGDIVIRLFGNSEFSQHLPKNATFFSTMRGGGRLGIVPDDLPGNSLVLSESGGHLHEPETFAICFPYLFMALIPASALGMEARRAGRAARTLRSAL